MIVLIVNEDHILTVKPEGQTPIPADPDRPVILKLPGERMQVPAFDPVRKNFSVPPVLKLLITMYSVTIRVTPSRCRNDKVSLHRIGRPDAGLVLTPRSWCPGKMPIGIASI